MTSLFFLNDEGEMKLRGSKKKKKKQEGGDGRGWNLTSR